MLFEAKIRSVGTFSDITACQDIFPYASLDDIHAILNSRKLIRWYKHNYKVINMLAITAPTFALTLFNVMPGTLIYQYLTSSTAISFSSIPATVPGIVNVVGAGTTVPTSFFGGKGAILLHMLVVGFFTLVVSSFLKFTGRGDLIPLVAFVGGGIILYEVIGLFNDIYGAIKTLINM
jgi:hypothetical protein